MIVKNFDIDLKNILVNQKHFHKRKNFKEVKISMVRKMVKFFGMLGYFGIHLGYLWTSGVDNKGNISNIKEMYTLGKSLMESYTQIGHVSS